MHERYGRAILVVLSLVLSGCVVSIEPIITESTATTDARLLGSWQEIGGNDRVVVTRGTGASYWIEYSNATEHGRFGARLGKLGSRTVLDLWPAPTNNKELDPYAPVLVPGHTLIAIGFVADDVSVALMDRAQLRRALGAGRPSLAYTDVGEQLILRGRTQEIRRGLTSYVAGPKAFDSDPSRFRRVAGSRP